MENQSTCRLKIKIGENICWYKIDYMLKLKNSQESPFDFGLKNNLMSLFCPKHDNHPNYIDWKKKLENL